MRFLIPVLMAALLYSCAPSRVVQPLKKGERTINASFGGPVINELGATFPIPLTTVTYAQGISDRATLFGTLQGELGAVYGLVMPDSAKRLLPGISIAPVINVASSVDDSRLWPQLDANAYWQFGQRNSFVYAGVSNWFELSARRSHEEPQENHWIWNPQLGATLQREKWAYNLEFKYLAPGFSNQEVVVNYAKPFGDQGALGAYFSITKKL